MSAVPDDLHRQHGPFCFAAFSRALADDQRHCGTGRMLGDQNTEVLKWLADNPVYRIHYYTILIPRSIHWLINGLISIFLFPVHWP